MRRSLLLSLVACVLLVLVATSASASAATVRVLGRDGHTHLRNDPYLRGPAAAPVLPPAFAQAPFGRPLTVSIAHLAGTKHHRHRHRAVTVKTALLKLVHRHTLRRRDYHTYLRRWHAALREERHLPAARSAQLAQVTVLMHGLAVHRKFTAGRLPALFLMLRRNAQWWREGSMLSYGERVQFTGDPLVWEYYPGYGLQLSVLANFGAADGLYEAGQKHWATLEQLLTELTSLAVHRAGGLTWEYYFNWEGGSPPWVSAMAQATGLLAMTNGYLATGNPKYLARAHQMLPLFEHSPPNGVTVKTALGLRFLQYSFAPGTDIINAFLQTLIGLHQYATVSGDQAAQRLFDRGNAQAVAELPSFVISGWSLYQPGVFDDVGYHKLVTGFAQILCKQTATPVYCHTADVFSRDLLSRPKLRQLTLHARSGHHFRLRFRVSKLAKVGAVIRRKGKNFLYTSAEFRAGRRWFKTGKLHRGLYNVAMSATDMAGNHVYITGKLRVCHRRCRRHTNTGGSGPTTTTTTTTDTGSGTTTTTTSTTTTTTTTTSTTTTTTGSSGGSSTGGTAL